MPLWKLLAYKIKIALSGFTRGQMVRRVARIIAVCAVLAAVALFVMGADAFFTVLGGTGSLGAGAAIVIVTLTFSAILVLALVFDIATTTNIFFLSSDLDLLMAAPVPTRRVFILKYIEAMVSGSFVALFVGFPVLFGYGLAFHAPAIFFVAVFVVTAIFITIPISIGTICGMVIARVVPATRVREILAFLSGVIGLGIWIGFQVLRPMVGKAGQMHDIGARMQALGSGGNPVLTLLPSRFPAEILVSLAAGKLRAAIPSLLYLVAISGVMFALSTVLAERLYLTGWTRSGPAARKTRRQRRIAAPSPGLWGWLPSTQRGIMRTTASLFTRDPQQITPVATLTVMMGLLPFFMGRQSGSFTLNPALVAYSVLSLSFVGSLNLAMNAVVIDGRAFWWLLAAPSRSLAKLGGKFSLAVSFFVPLASAVALGFGAAGSISWPMVAKSIWLAACFAALGASLGVLLGISYADWEWDTPKRMIKVTGRLALVGVMGAFFAAVGFSVKAFVSRGAVPKPDVSWVVLVPLGAAAALAAYSILFISSKKMDRMEWKL
jgi:ABC-2 type transport system permease protein